MADHPSFPSAEGSTAAVPSGAIGPTIPAEGYLIEELGDDLYSLSDGGYQMMFVVGDEGVVAVDAPPSLGHKILPAIAKVTSQPVTDVIYSHHHADHIGAASLYPDGVRRHAHRATADALAEVDDPNRPMPTHLFDNSQQIGEGKHQLTLDYHGPNHAIGNIFIHAPAQEVVMVVDLIWPGWVPFGQLGESTNITGWIRAHEQLLNYNFQTLVGGHLTRLGNRHDVETQQRYVRQLESAARDAIKTVDPGPSFGSADPANRFAGTNNYFTTLAQTVADAVTSDWVGTLGGADVFTFSNAWTMVEAMRIDVGILGPSGVRPPT